MGFTYWWRILASQSWSHMSPDLLMSKIAKRFELLDVDGDGAVTAADFQESLRRLAEEFGESPGAPKYEALSNAYAQLWEQLLRHADADGDGVVTREEYVASLHVDGPIDYGSVMRPLAKATLELCDTDDDGLIGREELRRVQRSLRMNTTDADLAFTALDRDGDGSVSLEELIRAIEEFYTSVDPAAPGNMAFGSY
ncbi:EF-hand domain-containing protein [Streptomyces luteogriseus]|uniref:EF-hand domain-containing protein n=1 Tax=Streptomyces luteogriseus TaxID=68233 RepID=UPI00382AA421